MENWREIPFVRFILPLIAGILLQHYFSFNRTALFIAMFLIAAFCVLISKKKFVYELRWVYGACLNLTILLFGLWMADRAYSNHFEEFLPQEHRKAGLLVKLNSQPQIKNKIRFTATVFNTINLTDNKLNAATGKLILYFDPTPESSKLKYGDLIQLLTPISPIPPPANPDAYDFRQTMSYAHIGHQAFPKENEWEDLGINNGNVIHSYAYAFQERLLDIIEHKLEGKQEKIVASALLLGDRSRITPELKAAYAETGAMHILAVSGLHVGLLFLVFSMLLKLVKIKRWYWRYVQSGLLLGIVWAFALITGLAPSVVRAAAMLSFIIVGITIHRNGNIYNTIAGSAFVLLVIDPNYLYQVGFQLSYLALLGIIYFQPKIYRLLQIGNPILDKVWALVTVSLSAQVLTFPISLYYFHQFPFYFWLSGIVVVPAATVVLPLGICLFLFGNVPGLGSLIAFSLEKILWMMNALVLGIQQLPFATTKGVWFSFPMLFLLYAAILCFTLATRKGNAKLLYAGILAVGFFALNYLHQANRQQNQSFVTMYSFNDRSVIDFVHGKTSYSLGSLLEADDKYKYAVSNHRSKHGIDNIIRLELHPQGDFPGLSAKNGLISFNGNRYLLVGDGYPDTHLQEADYLVVCGVQERNIDALITANAYKQIVFDKACHPGLVKEWKKLCKAKNQSYHDIRQSGYWQP